MDTNMNKQLDKDIEIAFKARGLMESMKQWDLVGWWRRLGKVAASAMAAMFVGFFFFPFGWTASNVGSEFASGNLAQYSSYASLKGAQDDPATLIAEAYVALNEKDYKTAAKRSKEAMERLEGTKDPFKLDMFQDAEWYNALANLSRGQLWYVMKAKIDLKHISSSDSKHKSDAEVLLKELK